MESFMLLIVLTSFNDAHPDRMRINATANNRCFILLNYLNLKSVSFSICDKDTSGFLFTLSSVELVNKNARYAFCFTI